MNLNYAKFSTPGPYIGPYQLYFYGLLSSAPYLTNIYSCNLQVRYSYLFNLLLKCHHHVLVTGPTGTGTK